jgi:hypothetical protein
VECLGDGCDCVCLGAVAVDGWGQEGRAAADLFIVVECVVDIQAGVVTGIVRADRLVVTGLRDVQVGAVLELIGFLGLLAAGMPVGQTLDPGSEGPFMSRCALCGH